MIRARPGITRHMHSSGPLGGGQNFIPPGGDPYFSSVVLLAVNDNAANGSTTFIDQSNSAHVLTAGGAAAYTNSTAPTGMTTVGASDGSTAVVSSPDSPDWDLSGGDWTIEFMIRFTSITSAMWVSQSDSAGDQGWVLGNYDSASTLLQLGVNGAVNDDTTWNTKATGTWYHVAWVLDGTTTRSYVGGVQKGTGSANAPARNKSFSFRFFKPGQAGLCLDGFMSNIRITKGVCRYPGGTTFTPPTLPLPTS